MGNLKRVMDSLAAEGVYLLREERNGVYTYHIGFRDVVFRSGSLAEMKAGIRDIWAEGKVGLERYLFRRYVRSRGAFYGLKYIEGSVKTSTRMVRQEFEYSCAAACVRQIAMDYKVGHSEEFIRKWLRTTTEGTNPFKVRPIAEKILKDVERVNVDGDQIFPKSNTTKAISKFKDLCKNEIPWIAQVKFEVRGEAFSEIIVHAVIVDKFVDGIVFIRDPSGLDEIAGIGGNGVEAQMLLDDFLDIWKEMFYDFVKFE